MSFDSKEMELQEYAAYLVKHAWVPERNVP